MCRPNTYWCFNLQTEVCVFSIWSLSKCIHRQQWHCIPWDKHDHILSVSVCVCMCVCVGVFPFILFPFFSICSRCSAIFLTDTIFFFFWISFDVIYVVCNINCSLVLFRPSNKPDEMKNGFEMFIVFRKLKKKVAHFWQSFFHSHVKFSIVVTYCYCCWSLLLAPSGLIQMTALWIIYYWQ